MKYRVIASRLHVAGKTPKMGEYIELTAEQALGVDGIVPYEVKVERPPKDTKVKKPARSSRQGRASRKKTSKRRTKKAKS